MIISGDTLEAADHTRGMGVIRELSHCTLDRAGVEVVRESMMSPSVVMISLRTR